MGTARGNGVIAMDEYDFDISQQGKYYFVKKGPITHAGFETYEECEAWIDGFLVGHYHGVNENIDDN